MPRATTHPRAPWIITGLAALCGVALAVAVAVAPGASGAATSSPGVDPMPGSPASGLTVESPTETTADVRTGAPENTTVYPLESLPQIDVWSVDAALPIDDDPFGELTGELARPRAAAPVFADPAGEPIGYLAHDAAYGGSVVPVVVHDTYWVKVLLSGRQGLPPSGSSAQAVGWLRIADVDLSPVESYVEVHLEARTIDIVSATGLERVASDFAWGKPSTPTPVGRTFVMLTTVVPEYAYTQGHPLVYLGVQSPTLPGFDGGEVAVTAFHFYRERSGPNSFGCIYLDGPATDRLAQLPAGTPVIIHP
ncbi:L,D-transpeptidase [Microbacterium sp. bgisy203]|uniref:L,D-transpeptidase n=1 Tax=Microbacterium sp. bgisy203 TaxID=3413799 RepID=UPI003D73F699